MSNPGAIPGVTKDGWHDYKVEWLGLVASGHTTPSVQPSIGNGTLVGRYIRLTNGLVIAKIALVFGSTTVAGTGDEIYAFSLPFPIYRWQGSALNPIGRGIAWMGPTASPSYMVNVEPSYLNTNAFSPFGVSQGRQDYYMTFHGAQAKNRGTGSIAGTNTSTTVTHGLGYTPYPSDILITPTSITAGAATIGQIYVTNVGATTFDVNVQTAPGASKTFSFSWKADAVPGAGGESFTTQAGSTKPFAWTEGCILATEVIYEARS